MENSLKIYDSVRGKPSFVYLNACSPSGYGTVRDGRQQLKKSGGTSNGISYWTNIFANLRGKKGKPPSHGPVPDFKGGGHLAYPLQPLEPPPLPPPPPPPPPPHAIFAGNVSRHRYNSVSGCTSLRYFKGSPEVVGYKDPVCGSSHHVSDNINATIRTNNQVRSGKKRNALYSDWDNLSSPPHLHHHQHHHHPHKEIPSVIDEHCEMKNVLGSSNCTCSNTSHSEPRRLLRSGTKNCNTSDLLDSLVDLPVVPTNCKITSGATSRKQITGTTSLRKSSLKQLKASSKSHEMLNVSKSVSFSTVNERVLRVLQKPSRDPFSSISSKKSILECDLTAYDLIKQHFNESASDVDDNLSDNVIEETETHSEDIVVVGNSLSSDSRKSSSSYTDSLTSHQHQDQTSHQHRLHQRGSQNISESSMMAKLENPTPQSLRIGGQGVKLFPKVKNPEVSSFDSKCAKNSSSGFFSEKKHSLSSGSLTKDYFPVPEPDYDSDSVDDNGDVECNDKESDDEDDSTICCGDISNGTKSKLTSNSGNPENYFSPPTIGRCETNFKTNYVLNGEGKAIRNSTEEPFFEGKFESYKSVDHLLGGNVIAFNSFTSESESGSSSETNVKSILKKSSNLDAKRSRGFNNSEDQSLDLDEDNDSLFSMSKQVDRDFRIKVKKHVHFGGYHDDSLIIEHIDDNSTVFEEETIYDDIAGLSNSDCSRSRQFSNQNGEGTEKNLMDFSSKLHFEDKKEPSEQMKLTKKRDLKPDEKQMQHSLSSSSFGGQPHKVVSHKVSRTAILETLERSRGSHNSFEDPVAFEKKTRDLSLETRSTREGGHSKYSQSGATFGRINPTDYSGNQTVFVQETDDDGDDGNNEPGGEERGEEVKKMRNSGEEESETKEVKFREEEQGKQRKLEQNNNDQSENNDMYKFTVSILNNINTDLNEMKDNEVDIMFEEPFSSTYSTSCSSSSEYASNYKSQREKEMADNKVIIDVSLGNNYDGLPINEHIYESIDSESIYNEGNHQGEQQKKSIFDGASKAEILEYLEDAKERVEVLINSNSSDASEVIITKIEEEEEESLNKDKDHFRATSHSIINQIQNNLSGNSSRRNRTSNVSNSSTESAATTVSTDSIDTEDENLKMVLTNTNSGHLVERNDSGVGIETSKPLRLRKSTSSQIIGETDHQCADCECTMDPQQNEETGSLFYSLACHKCEKKRTERKEIISEFVDTEFKYGRDLRIIREEFYRPMEVAGLLNKEQIKCVFINLDELIGVNSKFSEKLQDAIDIATEQGDEDFTTVNIGKIFVECSGMLHPFETYCIGQASASLLLNHLEKEKELLRIFLRVSQMENTLLRRMNLSAFLMVPVQRVTKYPLLLNRLYKVTPYHHQDREALREAQQKVELHLEHINQQTKGTGAPTKIWRRISSLSASNRRLANIEDIGDIKLRKIALEALNWSREEAQFIMIGKLNFIPITDPNMHKKGRTLKFSSANALFITLGKDPNYDQNFLSEDVEKEMFARRDSGVKEGVLLLMKEKNGRYILLRDPLFLSSCVISTESDAEDMFEIHDQLTKESWLFKAEIPAETRDWFRQIRYFSQGLGNWKKRRNALPNIMVLK